MFISLELWDEELRHDSSQPVSFGSALDANLDMRQLKVRQRPINLNGILSFETMRIWTMGRPGTKESKRDVLSGVRLLLADGSQYVVINDRDPSFVTVLALARQTNEAVYDYGPSAYMRRFGSQSTSAQ
jgi:hypothetical protein